jgi:hypothetical protein
MIQNIDSILFKVHESSEMEYDDDDENVLGLDKKSSQISK